ncbi:MAG: 4-alpha-glucanotransferase [Armatimonadota bacterium]|nr:4-alpha-glucanotransferase [Armatimonadota bacterium]
MTQEAMLRSLAALYGVQTVYFDVYGRRQRASVESLLAVLRALGAPLEGLRDVPEALRAVREAHRQAGCEPVAVAWDGRLRGVELRLPAVDSPPLDCRLHLQDGKSITWRTSAGRLRPQGEAQIGEGRNLLFRLPMPGRLPPGYHQLVVRAGRRRWETMLICAPRRAYLPAPEGPAAHTWGVFLPLYALRSRRSWGTGDFTDLEALLDWVGGLGGGVVATLPLLAAFLDEPCEPSPYVPASRLFWNELYLDPARSPDLPGCPEAQELLGSAAHRRELARLRKAPLVDYRAAMRVKRPVLEALTRSVFREPSARRDALFSFVTARPHLEDYARFRAVGERLRCPWPAWPPRLRQGNVQQGDYDEDARRYHLYVQWLAHEQLSALAGQARQRGSGLYLDLPLGVHPDGYDVWREREVFARGVSGGAPPDAFFTRGQDWGFPPLHPQRLRAQRYRYFIQVIRHHLEHAGVLRLDHIMALHRLFWVPQGMEARQGVYVTYPAEELYAILTLESHRHRAVIVGEDLGTVPPQVRRAMHRHGLVRMYVVQYEARPDAARPLGKVTEDFLAELNTHDMPPFAAFWQGLDIRERQALGLLDAAAARVERRERQRLRQAIVTFLRARRWLEARSAGAAGVLRALLAYLAAGPARIVVLNLEDLWLERRPQNVPGTGSERPNWRRKARYYFEEFRRLRQVTSALRLVHRLRRAHRDRGGMA